MPKLCRLKQVCARMCELALIKLFKNDDVTWDITNNAVISRSNSHVTSVHVDLCPLSHPIILAATLAVPLLSEVA